jgi:uncharacterized membrane protein YfcA
MVTDPAQILLLLVAGFAAGVMNAVAGGGKLFVLPALVAGGLSPLTANITANVVLGPGAAAAVWEYLGQLKRVPAKYFLLLIPCFAGATIGLLALRNTDESTFAHLTPWLMLIGVVFFALQPAMNKLASKPLHKRPRASWLVITFLMFLGSIYGGYFGVGFGFLLMGLLGLTSLKSVYQFAAIKNIVACGIDVMGAVFFTIVGGIAWGPGIVAMLGCILGGLMGAHFALKLPQPVVRTSVLVIGVAITAWIFIQSYH